MFSDEHEDLNKFIYALLGFCAFFIPGPIIPIITLVIAIGFLVAKIKAARESPEGFESLMFDIICIGVVIVISLVLSFIRIIALPSSTNYNYSSSSSESWSASDFAEAAILAYELENYELFSNGGNNLNKIRNGFKKYLETKMERSSVTVKGNTLTCYYGLDEIVFTIKNDDITYVVN